MQVSQYERCQQVKLALLSLGGGFDVWVEDVSMTLFGTGSFRKENRTAEFTLMDDLKTIEIKVLWPSDTKIAVSKHIELNIVHKRVIVDNHELPANILAEKINSIHKENIDD